MRPILVPALFIALLLAPARTQQDDNAPWKPSGDKLGRICQTAVLWALDNNGKMPDHVAQLVADGLDTELLVSPRIGGVALKVTAADREAALKDYKPLAEKLKDHCDYVFALLPPEKTTDLPREIQRDLIIAWEKPGIAKDGIVVHGAGSRSRFIPAEKIADAFEANNKARKTYNFPLIDIKDGLPVGPLPRHRDNLHCSCQMTTTIHK